MAKVKYNPEETYANLRFWCPGCQEYHMINICPGGWTFNGDIHRTTITPSILVRGHRDEVGNFICHSFVTDGKIQFLSDCTHELAGQTIELPDIESQSEE